MRLLLGIVLLVITLESCRGYDLNSRLADQKGLVPPDQFARYGREQAQSVAIAREFGRAYDGPSAEELKQQEDTAITYARSLPDIVDIQADPLGQRLTARFRSGWLTMATPADDGKRGAETVGLPPVSGRAPKQ